MSAEYDPQTGETRYPNETDEQRAAREAREKAGVGRPVEGGEDVESEEQRRKDQEKARKEQERKAKESGRNA